MQAKPVKRQDNPVHKEKAGRSSTPAADHFIPAEKTSARIFDLNRYIKDNQNSPELIETVKDALSEIDTVLQEMRSFSEKAAGDKKSPYQQTLTRKAIDSYAAEIERIVVRTEIEASRML